MTGPRTEPVDADDLARSSVAPETGGATGRPGPLHADALAVLDGWRAPSSEQEALRSAYAALLRSHPDGVWRSCLPRHLTAGALVLGRSRERVLLNLHRKAGRWFHFGGHLEPGDATLAGAALREAREESGLAGAGSSGLLLDTVPLHLSAHEVDFCGDTERVTHLDVRFLAWADDTEQPVVSDESLDVRWWPVDALPTEEPDMVAMITAALDRSAEPDVRDI